MVLFATVPTTDLYFEFRMTYHSLTLNFGVSTSHCARSSFWKGWQRKQLWYQMNK